MATSVNVPKLGIAMTEGKLVSWLVADGDTVSAGEPLYLLETDKVENEIDAPVSGTIRFLCEAGDTYPVGTLIAEIDDEG